MSTPLTFLCVMEAGKGIYGVPFLRQIKAMGHRLLVLTNARHLGLDWPRELLDGLYAVPDLFDPTLVRNAVSYLARQEAIDRIVGLGEYDIEIAAALREHLRLPGMSLSTSYHFRDKLAMRVRAAQAGLPIPAFTGTFNDWAVHTFTQDVPGPWVLKPRTGASSKGIRKLHHPQAVWDHLHALGDERSNHLLERYTPGFVFHVDSIVAGGVVCFAAVHQYGTPILDLHTHGGIYSTRMIGRGSADETALQALNRQVIQALGPVEGVTHIEYIKGQDGRYYFLEASSRVGAGMIEDLIEAASGLNLWAEWAKIEAGPYRMPEPRTGYAGVAICMTAHEVPDLSRFGGEGVMAMVPKPYHAAVLVQSADPAVLETTLAANAERLARELGPVHAH